MAWVDNQPRFGTAAVIGAVFLLVFALGDGFGPRAPVSEGPNIIVIVTDDQSFATIPYDPPAMPYLQSQLADPNSDWIRYPNAFVNTALCCPSRSTILSGQYAHHTGVVRNRDGEFFDDTSTIATWLDAAGYYTGLFGKYLNLYPFGREPFIPPGWDRWIAKLHGGVASVYFDYTLNRDGELRRYGAEPQDYMPDVLAADAREFIESAPAGRPFFLYLAPTAPHAPWLPAPRHEGAFSGVRFDHPASIEEERRDKPGWVRALPEVRRGDLERLDYERRNEFEALLAVDDAIRGIMTTLEERDELDDTVIFFLSDNGYSYGEHGVVAKRCPYDECARVPFFVRVPGAGSGDDPLVVSNTDIAPTIARLAGATPTRPIDGVVLPRVVRSAPDPDRPGVLIEWAGDLEVPPFWALRTERYLYVEYPTTGEVELYDEQEDPLALHNIAGDPRSQDVQDALAAQLAPLIPPWGATPGAPAEPVTTP